MAEALEVASPQKLLLGLLFKDLRGSYERSLLRIYGRSYEGLAFRCSGLEGTL